MWTSLQTPGSRYKAEYKYKGGHVWTVYFQQSMGVPAYSELVSFKNALMPFLEYFHYWYLNYNENGEQVWEER